MTIPLASTGASTALPALNVHSHGHGYKKGLESLDQPSGSTQNLFGSLLTSLEQVIGTQPANGTSQHSAAGKTAAVGQTNTQVAPATSAWGDAAKSLLGAVGTALKLFA